MLADSGQGSFLKSESEKNAALLRETEELRKQLQAASAATAAAADISKNPDTPLVVHKADPGAEQEAEKLRASVKEMQAVLSSKDKDLETAQVSAKKAEETAGGDEPSKTQDNKDVEALMMMYDEL